MAARAPGFTLIELVVAITMLTVGILALASAGALIARLIVNGHRAAVATAFAAQRAERLRTMACSGASLLPGSEQWTRGAVVMVSNRWSVSKVGRTWRLDLTTTYRTAENRRRTFRLETAALC